MSPSAISATSQDQRQDNEAMTGLSTIVGMPEHSYLMDRNLNCPPLEIIDAQGNFLYTSDNRQILDGSGGAAVSCLGHGHPRVLKAVASQMRATTYCNSASFSVPSTNNIAKDLAQSAGAARAYICCSGSEAMEGAMKLGRQYFQEIGQPQRVNFIAREQSYHGTTLGALSLSGHTARRKNYIPLLSTNIYRVSACYAYRQMSASETDAEFVAKKAAELERKLLEVGPETVIGFVCEPISGATLGCVPYVSGYLAAMKAVCVRYDILFILDEVMCGMGRSGTMHAWQAEHSDQPGHDCKPDMQTVGKGLGGGYQPVAAILISSKIVDALQQGSGSFVHGHTYQAFPVSCAAAFAVQQIIKEENLLENVRKQGEYLSSLLHQRLDSHPYIGDIRGRGLFWGIEIVKNKGTKEPFDSSLGIAQRLQAMALSRKWDMGIYVGQGTADGERGDHAIISPAYNVTRDVIEDIVERMVGVIDDVFQELATEAVGSKMLIGALSGLTIQTSSTASAFTSDSSAVNTPSSIEVE